VGRAQQLHPPLTPPLLSQQLLTGINREVAAAFIRHRPDIAAGPNPVQTPDIPEPLTEQQGTPFLRPSTREDLAQNGEQAVTCQELHWRLAGHTDTL
jgi:hypothetical protein